MPSVKQSAFIELLKNHVFDVQGKTTFKEEFVTAGGVSTREVEPSSMQSRIIDGLYFGGEVIDVDGITGGYNFQHAWTSGWIAARHISSRI
jgi:predicted flavoprotein YhiN